MIATADVTAKLREMRDAIRAEADEVMAGQLRRAHEAHVASRAKLEAQRDELLAAAVAWLAWLENNQRCTFEELHMQQMALKEQLRAAIARVRGGSDAS